MLCGCCLFLNQEQVTSKAVLELFVPGDWFEFEL